MAHLRRTAHSSLPAHRVPLVALRSSLVACSLVVAVTAAGCSRSSEPGTAASSSLAAAAASAQASTALDEPGQPADPRRLILGTSPIVSDYDIRQQVVLDPQTVGRHYQRFPDVGAVLQSVGWETAVAYTFVKRSGPEVPPTVTMQVDRFSSPGGAGRFLAALRQNGSPSLSHFLDLAQPANPVRQDRIGEDAVALEAGLLYHGTTPQVVAVRHYAFRRGALVGQVTVVREGLKWPEILTLAQAQDERFVIDQLSHSR